MPTTVVYSFGFGDGHKEDVRLDVATDWRTATPRDQDKGWVSLAHNQCPHCPLPATGDCPFAVALASFARHFEPYYSYEPVQVEVTTAIRKVRAERDLQHAMASLVGLVGATSGCPRLRFFRPMAHFHQPFASEEETLFRAFSIHLLGRYLSEGGKSCIHPDFETLRQDYQGAALVNRCMAERIRGTFHSDALVNALVILNTYAEAAPVVIEERLAELAYIFIPPPDDAPGP